MLVSHRHRFIFLKTIKTAGSSIELALQQALLPACDPKRQDGYDNKEGIVGARGDNPQRKKYWNHMNAKDVYDGLGYQKFNAYFRTSAIRNPFDKVVSWFFFGFHKKTDFASDREAFNSFLANAPRFPVDRTIYTIGGAIVCESFVRFERLQPDADALIARLTGGKQTKLSLSTAKAGNRDKSIPFQDYYNKASRDAVARAFAFELENFGYTFKGSA